MSWKASGFVKEVTGITRSEKLLLLLLGDYYDESRGWAWPGIERLASEGMMSVRHTIRLLQSLERKGVIEISRSEGSVNRYRFRGYSTPDTVSPVTSDVTPTRDIWMSPEPSIEPTKMMTTEREKYEGVMKLTGTQSGVHAPQKYFNSAEPQDYEPANVVEAVRWVGKAMGVPKGLTLPTPSYLPALSRLGAYVKLNRVRPNDLAIMRVVDAQDRVRERLLYGVSRQVGHLIGALNT